MNYQFSTYRYNNICAKSHAMGLNFIDLMVTGVTGAGKSTTLNSFFQRPVAEVGTGVDPKTMEIQSYFLNKFFRIWDTPGLGDGVAIDQVHKKKMVDLLTNSYDGDCGTIDMALVIIEGSNRDMGTTYSLINELMVPNLSPDRILVAINQADMAMKGRHWDPVKKEPDAQLRAFLNEQALSIQRRVKEATGVRILKPVCYSAEYNWNIPALFDFIIDHMPTERRKLKLR